VIQSIVATFARPDDADVFIRLLDARIGVDAASQTIGARGEPWDGHRLVATWVPEERVAEARNLAVASGGLVHDGQRDAAS
jgi:hypothetical protein